MDKATFLTDEVARMLVEWETSDELASDFAKRFVSNMREPTDQMISAGLAALFPDVEFHPAADEEAVLARAFRAMIDAA